MDLKKTTIKAISFVFIIFAAINNSEAQIMIDIQKPTVSAYKVEDIWNFTIISNNINPTNVFFLIEVNDSSNNLLMKAQTNPMLINVGNLVVTPEKLSKYNYNITDIDFKEKMKQSPFFPNGKYELCLKVIDNNEDLKLAEQCILFQIQNDSTQSKQKNSKSETNKDHSPIKFGGYAEITAQLSNQPTFSNEIDENFVQAIIQPAISVYGIPLTLNTFNTSQQRKGLYEMNSNTISFDKRSLQESLSERLKKQLEEKRLQKEQMASAKYRDLYEYQRLAKVFQNPQITKELEQLNLCDSLKELLADSLILKDTKKRDSIQRCIDRLYMIEQKREGYEKLKNRYEKLRKGLPNLMDSSKVDADSLIDLDSFKKYYTIKQLKADSNISIAEELAFNIKSLDIGTVYPEYSDFTIKRVPIKGYNVEIQPGNLYLASTYGTLTENLLFPSDIPALNKNKITCTGFGYEKDEDRFLKFYYLQANMKSSVESTEENPYLQSVSKQNQVYSVVFRQKILEENIVIKGEFAGSRNLIENSEGNYISIPNDSATNNHHSFSFFNKKLFNTGQLALASMVGIEGSLLENKTKFSIARRKVAPDFKSAGMPYLKKDLVGIEGKLEQKLVKNRIQLSSFVRSEKYNINNYADFKYKMFLYRLEASINFPKYPAIRLSYMPVLIVTDTQKLNLCIKSAGVSYSYNLFKLKQISNINYNHQSGVNTSEGKPFSVQMGTISHQILLPKNIGLIFSGNEVYSKNTDSSSTKFYLSSGILFPLFKRFNNSIGLSKSWDNSSERIGYFAQTLVNISKKISFQMRYESSDFNNFRQTNNIYNINETPYIADFYIFRTSLIVHL